MNIAALLPAMGITGTDKRLTTATDLSGMDRDIVAFDDSAFNRKRHLLLRRMPGDGLIRRLITNPPHIVSSDTMATLVEEMRSTYHRFRLPLQSTHLNL